MGLEVVGSGLVTDERSLNCAGVHFPQNFLRRGGVEPEEERWSWGCLLFTVGDWRAAGVGGSESAGVSGVCWCCLGFSVISV